MSRWTVTAAASPPSPCSSPRPPRGDEDADGLLVDAFCSLEEAARAHAYLSGWVLQLLAASRGEDMATTLAHVRETLAR